MHSHIMFRLRSNFDLIVNQNEKEKQNFQNCSYNSKKQEISPKCKAMNE